MSKFSQKQTKDDFLANDSDEKSVSSNDKQLNKLSYNGWTSTAKENKFEGMAANVQRVEAVIIPGYKVRG